MASRVTETLALVATCAVATLALSATLGPGGALASDSSATESYLRANLALVTAGHRNLPGSIAGYRSVLMKVRGQCPRIAASSPQDPESSQLSDEVIGTMVLSAGKPDLGAIATYLRTVRDLRWSSGAVNRAVASYTSMLRTLYKLPIPDLCGDVGKWAAGGFASLAPTTKVFDAAFLPNWVALGLVPAGMSNFESATSRSLARRAGPYERQLTDAEAKAVETYGSIMDALELNQ